MDIVNTIESRKPIIADRLSILCNSKVILNLIVRLVHCLDLMLRFNKITIQGAA